MKHLSKEHFTFTCCGSFFFFFKDREICYIIIRRERENIQKWLFQKVETSVIPKQHLDNETWAHANYSFMVQKFGILLNINIIPLTRAKNSFSHKRKCLWFLCCFFIKEKIGANRLMMRDLKLVMSQSRRLSLQSKVIIQNV